MAKAVQKERVVKKKTRVAATLSLEKTNYQIILGGVAVIIAGYLALSAKPWDNPMAMNVAPILLVLGYCVIVPIGILYKSKKQDGELPETAEHA